MIVVMLTGWVTGCWISLNCPSVERVGTVTLDASVHYSYADSPPLVCIPRASGAGRVQLMTLDTSFSFTPKADVQLENLFGTAEGEDGLRLEYSNGPVGTDGTLVFVHALPQGGPQVHHFSHAIQARHTYSCRIILTETKDLEIYLDAKKVSLVRPRPDAIFYFDGLRLGSKYNKSQPFTRRCDSTHSRAQLAGLGCRTRAGFGNRRFWAAAWRCAVCRWFSYGGYLPID